MADQDDLSWGVARRYEFIEWRAYWTGHISRKDLEDEFQISAAQASLDLRSYQERMPGNIDYSPSEKTHVLNAKNFNPEFLRLSPERYLLQMQAITTGAIPKSDTWFDTLPPVEAIPQIARWPHAYVLRELIQAIEKKNSVSVNYQSLTRMETRTICPHAFGYDGNRWHVRAWSPDREEFRDFVLSRIRSIGAAEACIYDPSDDIEWHTPITLKLTAHPELDNAERMAIEHDYRFENAELNISMPIALAFYFVRRHNLDLRSQSIDPKRLQLFLANYEEYEKTTEAARQISKARAAMRKANALALSSAR